MKTYEGRREIDGLKVTVDGRPLGEHYDVKQFTSWGFEWTYEGNGPAQLALALLADCLSDEADAIGWHQDFKSAVVAGLPLAGWTLTEQEIQETLYAFENE